ncbi:MAG: DUF2225 domain-containing protein [Armatimonadetes bacterium]|nr:DUF2225 domain-containing protein [Armatimonadota bacterium]
MTQTNPSKNPFLEKRLDCPACEAETVQKIIKTKLYTPGERESDQHVVSYTWLDPDFQGINPSFYFIFTCPSCNFADVSSDFEDPSKDPKNSAIRKIFQNAGTREKDVLQTLVKHVDPENVTFESAMNAHLAAIYIQELPPDPEYRNATKLARLCLRAAWLWREQNPSSEGGPQPHNIGLLVDRVERAFEPMDLDMNRVRDACTRRAKELGLPDVNPYQDALSGLQRAWSNFRKCTAKLRHTFDRDQRGELMSKSSAKYNGFPSYFDFLLYMADRWSGIPTNERDCLAKAVHYFTEAYMREFDVEAVEKTITTNALIVDLHMRLEDYEKALSSVVSLYKNSMDTKMELQKRLRDSKKEKKMSEKDLMAVGSTGNSSPGSSPLWKA